MKDNDLYVDFLHGAEEIMNQGYEARKHHYEEIISADLEEAINEGLMTQEEVDDIHEHVKDAYGL